MTVAAATDAAIFLAYVDRVLAPERKPGDVVVLDNLSSHKLRRVRERIALACMCCISLVKLISSAAIGIRTLQP